MKNYFRMIMLLLLLSLKGMAADNDSLRVLWIGNSYTYFNDLPTLVRDIAGSQRVKLSMTAVLKGGERLAGHLKNEQLLKAFKQGGWDYVIVQEQSTLPAMSTAEVNREVYPYAHTIDSLIHQGSPKAQVILYMTWGHKYGTIYKVDYPLAKRYDTMQERLITSYLEMAIAENAWCAPVGMAWRTIRQTHPELQLYADDTTHPSLLGSYLAANVIFTTIYQKPYQTGVKRGIDDATAELLQQTAQQCVLDNLGLLNIKH